MNVGTVRSFKGVQVKVQFTPRTGLEGPKGQ
jgi:hypothetical protein